MHIEVNISANDLIIIIQFCLIFFGTKSIKKDEK